MVSFPTTLFTRILVRPSITSLDITANSLRRSDDWCNAGERFTSVLDERDKIIPLAVHDFIIALREHTKGYSLR